MQTQVQLLLFLIILSFFNKDLSANTDCSVYVRGLSSGYLDQNKFEVYVNSELIDLNIQRGIGIIQIDQFTKEIYDKQVFDTNGNFTSVEEMIQYIRQIPTDRVVIIGVKDDGSRHMNQVAWNTLYAIGLTDGEQFGFRDGFILIGGYYLKASEKAVWQIKKSGQGTAQQQLCVTQKIPIRCQYLLSVVQGRLLRNSNFQYYINHQKQDSQFAKEDHNIIVLDQYTKKIKKTQTFILSQQDQDIQFQQDQEYIQFLQNIEKGDIVIIGAKKGFIYLTKFQKELENFGGSIQETLTNNRFVSFAFIGSKGSQIGSAVYNIRKRFEGVLVEKCIPCLQDPNRNQNSPCSCKEGYYDDTKDHLCKKCSHKCQNCEQNADKCTECVIGKFRNKQPPCECINGYFEDKTQNVDCIICGNNFTWQKI